MKRQKRKQAETSRQDETAYLLRSPRNAARLLQSLREAKQGTLKPQSVKHLRREFGLTADD